ncbi:MAG: sensor histidine kinase [Planctomycetia bacterium]
MSLRVQLLAVVVGLNALLLLSVSLLLVLGPGEATRAAALAYLLRPTREQVAAGLPRWSPGLDGVWLVEDERSDGEPVPGAGREGEAPAAPAGRALRVYDARAWQQAADKRRVAPLPPGAPRDTAVGAYQRSLEPGGTLAPRGLVVASLDQDREVGRRWALVAEVTDARDGARRAYVAMLGGLLLVSLGTWAFLSRKVVRPLDALTRAASRVASGDASARLPEPHAQDELARTAAAFNRMAEEVAEYQGRLEDRVLTGLEQVKKAEQHLAVAERLAATGKLAAGIAHEINNPLGGMKNALRALARGDLEPAKRDEYLALVQDGLLRIEETVKKVLAFTPRRVEPRRVDLRDVAQRAWALARHRVERKGATGTLVLDGAGAPVGVFGDPLELQQVALNLLLNAADALPAQGGEVRVQVEARGPEAALVVADNGCGMDEETRLRCFDLFFTTKQVGEGTGLGLSVAHTIVSNHGGRIEVESRPGAGTTFTVLLPLESPEAPAAS